jgi:hypothetical protein
LQELRFEMVQMEGRISIIDNRKERRVLIHGS